MGSVRVSCQRGGSEKCLATVTVDREGVGPEVRSLWAKLGSRPQLCSLEDKQTEVNPYHGMSKGILACGGKATLLKAEENSQSSESEKKKFQKALARNTHRAEHPVDVQPHTKPTVSATSDKQWGGCELPQRELVPSE